MCTIISTYILNFPGSKRGTLLGFAFKFNLYLFWGGFFSVYFGDCNLIMMFLLSVSSHLIFLNFLFICYLCLSHHVPMSGPLISTLSSPPFPFDFNLTKRK